MAEAAVAMVAGEAATRCVAAAEATAAGLPFTSVVGHVAAAMRCAAAKCISAAITVDRRFVRRAQPDRAAVPGTRSGFLVRIVGAPRISDAPRFARLHCTAVTGRHSPAARPDFRGRA